MNGYDSKYLNRGKARYGSEVQNEFEEQKHPRDDSGKFGAGSSSASARLKKAYKQPSKAYSKEKVKEYKERLKTESDPETIAALKKAIAAHEKR